MKLPDIGARVRISTPGENARPGYGAGTRVEVNGFELPEVTSIDRSNLVTVGILTSDVVIDTDADVHYTAVDRYTRWERWRHWWATRPGW